MKIEVEVTRDTDNTYPPRARLAFECVRYGSAPVVTVCVDDRELTIPLQEFLAVAAAFRAAGAGGAWSDE